MAVDLENNHHDLVADRNLILYRVDTIIGELADADQSLFARKDLNESAEAHDACHLAHVQCADLDLLGDAVDSVECALGALGVA